MFTIPLDSDLSRTRTHGMIVNTDRYRYRVNRITSSKYNYYYSAQNFGTYIEDSSRT